MKKYYILAINPGSTSTKMAVFENETEAFSETVEHTSIELETFLTINDQFEFRKKILLDTMKNRSFNTEKLAAIVGRGGILPPVESGGYTVNDAMRNYLWKSGAPQHASNLGALLADAIAKPLGIPAFIYDAVSSDEMEDVARITGFPEIRRKSLCHVLNSKAAGRNYAEKLGKTYETVNLIIAHLGGGISISAHKKGKIIDVIAEDSGPFSPERSGGAPLLGFVDYVYDNHFEKNMLIKKIRGQGGLKALMGVSDLREIEKQVRKGDEKAGLVYRSLIYQIAKGIGEMATVLKGELDGIVLTGGMVYSDCFSEMIEEYIKYLGPVSRIPGEKELKALALGGLRMLKGEENPHVFTMEISHSEAKMEKIFGK